MMRSSVFDKNIHIECPEDFYEMDNNELKKYFASDMLRFGARNAEKHMILSVGKMKSSFVNFLTDAQNVLNGAEHSLRTLKGYCCKNKFEEIIFGKKAKGLQFEYEATNGTKQLGEMAVVKLKSCFYVIYCLGQLADFDEATKLFKDFRSSLRYI